MKAQTRKRLGMVREVLEPIDKHKEHGKMKVSVYGIRSATLIPEAKELFRRRLKHFDDSSGGSSWIRWHNGRAKDDDYLAGDLSFTMHYPKRKGGDEE